MGTDRKAQMSKNKLEEKNMEKIEELFTTVGWIIKVGSSETKEVKLENEDGDINITVKGNLHTDLMRAFGKYLIDENSEITIDFSIPDKTQKSIEDF